MKNMPDSIKNTNPAISTRPARSHKKRSLILIRHFLPPKAIANLSSFTLWFLTKRKN